jgi:hypothetical protein
MLKWREKRANIVGRDFDVWVARMTTGGAPRGGVEVLRWYLWARALHWQWMSWYEGKIA